MRTSPLHAYHADAGARFAPYAGWELPLWYTSIRQEHAAVREAAGMFDVSHMGQVEVSGREAVDFLQLSVSNDVAALTVGRAQYAVMCDADGGVIDDLFIYRLERDRFLVVTNGATHAGDFAWLEAFSRGFAVTLHNRADDFAMVAVQGPTARSLVQLLADQPLPRRMEITELQVAGVSAYVAGTGYTGEDGVEVLASPTQIGVVWSALRDLGVTPAGLGARDSLRLEVCFHLYGNDLDRTRDPISAGLGWCCKEATGFLGSEAIAKVRMQGPREILIPFEMTDGGIARAGDRVIRGGTVTSGLHSPSLGIGIGMAYVPTRQASVGTQLEIDVRGRRRTAVVKSKPLYQVQGA